MYRIKWYCGEEEGLATEETFATVAEAEAYRDFLAAHVFREGVDLIIEGA